MAYVYLIGWTKADKYYIGVRFAKDCTPDDLWVTYFTSSKHVRTFAEAHGSPDIVQIRKTFNDPTAARVYESKLLRRMRVVTDSRFINKTDNVSIDTQAATHLGSANGMYGRKHSEETLELMRSPKSTRHRDRMRGPRPHVSRKGLTNNASKGYVVTPHGKFESQQEAAGAEGVHQTTISLRLKSSEFNNYYYERAA